MLQKSYCSFGNIQLAFMFQFNQLLPRVSFPKLKIIAAAVDLHASDGAVGHWNFTAVHQSLRNASKRILETSEMHLGALELSSDTLEFYKFFKVTSGTFEVHLEDTGT